MLPPPTPPTSHVEGHGFVLNSNVSWKRKDASQGQTARPIVPFANETHLWQIVIDVSVDLHLVPKFVVLQGGGDVYSDCSRPSQGQGQYESIMVADH